MIKKLKKEGVTNKGGRPQKYKTEDARKEAIRNYNRINQIACRKRKRIKRLEQEISVIIANKKRSNKENNKIYSVKNNKFNYEYREALMNFFNEFEYDTLFTGTLKPSKQKENEFKDVKDYINYQTQRHEQVLDSNIVQKMGVNSFIKKTKEYIVKLSEKKLFTRCFGVFELGKNNQIHVHILFKKTELIRGFNTLLKNKWKIGISNTQNIKKREKNTTVGYCLKELKALSFKKSDTIMIESWFFEGNFDRLNN